MAQPRRTEDLTDSEFAEAQAEHREEHAGDIVMDCPICLDDWQAISGQPWGTA